uniref:Coiled-coil domain-containing protein 86 n=1 Tax=Amphimedon queenslandica TaxID=400682 RepID=A0A1X7USH2_AMPQE
MASVGPIRGKSKSGRVWRDPGQKSFNSIAVSSLKQPWNKRQRELAEKKAAKELERELKETARQEKEEKKRRTEENKKRREENAKKSEIVQKITNTAKLKRLSKKQLKMIKKR